MPAKSPSRIIGPPADTLAETLESVAGDRLQILTEYDTRDYQLLYVADWVLEKYGGREALADEAETLHGYHHLDRLEANLLEETLSLGEVRTFVTFLDHGLVVRAHIGEAGVYIALGVGASVDDVQTAIENTLQG